jgi:hypothetical protein
VVKEIEATRREVIPELILKPPSVLLQDLKRSLKQRHHQLHIPLLISDQQLTIDRFGKMIEIYGP